MNATTEMRSAGTPQWQAGPELFSPFQETFAEPEADEGKPLRFDGLNGAFTPFATTARPEAQGEADRLFLDAFSALRDEGFDEALAWLAEETEQAVADRFTGEAPAPGAEAERFAETLLAPVRFEAEQYVDRLQQGMASMDIASLSEQQLGEVLERFDPKQAELTPAGEEFIGKFIEKAKSAVKVVAGAVGKVANIALGPVLEKLRALVNPLLRRVLSFAIGRLPVPLQGPARKLATMVLGKDAVQGEDDRVSPASLVDVEALAESFDAALAQSLTTPDAGEVEREGFAGERPEDVETRQLEALAAARGALIDRIRNAADEEDLAPAIEQFLPAVLTALRMGISLIGRPKVVSFLAGYVSQLIRRWVGPELSGPLANAIVDTGLRLATLEAETGMASGLRHDEAAPVALASVIEDTVRRLAEQDEAMLENEELMQLATAEAFTQAVSTHFPGQLLRPELQQAPSLGGTFVAQRPRSTRSYRKYSRVPEVEITPQLADALPAFGGTTLGAALRASGAGLPMRARMHIYQAAPGTSVPATLRMDRAGAGRGFVATAGAHPLTPAAAGLLLREPRLGVAVPPAYLQSRHRIAAGQRFYVLEAAGTGGLAHAPQAAVRTLQARSQPTRVAIRVDQRRGTVTVGFYLSEADAQAVAGALRGGRGTTALLQALQRAWAEIDRTAAAAGTPLPMQREDEEFSPASVAQRLRRVAPAVAALLRPRLGGWVLPALAEWVRHHGEAFARAAAHPDAGVTVRVRLSSVPGLGPCTSCGAPGAGQGGTLRVKPQVEVSVHPGRVR